MVIRRRSDSPAGSRCSGAALAAHEAPDVCRADSAASVAGDIAKLALKRGLIKCQGKTPEATMASALYTDVKRKESNSVFIRPHEGLFGLREWADKGLVFKVGSPSAGLH